MKYTELKKGGYYNAIETKGGNSWYLKINYCDGENVYCYVNFCPNAGSFYNETSPYWANDASKWTYKELDYLETMWVEECILQNKIVDKSNIHSYEIY